MKPKGTQFTDEAGQVEYYGMNKREGTHGGVFRDPQQTEVLPAKMTGVETVHRESHADQAYYNAHKYYEPEVAEKKGWAWAYQAANVATNREGGVRARPVVHEVVPKPGSKVDLDPYTKEWRAPDQGSLVSNKGLDITDTHWIPPVHPSYAAGGVVGHQGTLPNVNWNQFGPRDLEQRNWKVLR